MFSHCYHNKMDALIPERKTYAVNFLAKNYGDLLASYSPEKNIVYSLTEKRKLYESKAMKIF